MSWVRIDDNITFHRKIVEAGNAAVGAWMRMTAWSAAHLTDGAIPLRIATLIADGSSSLKTLVAVGLLDQDGDGYRVHDYLHHNPTAAEVKAERAKKSEAKSKAGRSGGIASGIARRSSGEANHEAESKQTGSKSKPPSPSPSPSPKDLPVSPPPLMLIHPSASPPGEAPKKDPKPDPKPPDPIKPLADEVCSAFSDRWVAAFRPADGLPPKITTGDFMQARALVKAHGLPTAIRLVDRFLADADPWLIRNGHALRHIGSRVDGYRATAAPAPAPRPTQHDRPRVPAFKPLSTEGCGPMPEAIKREMREKLGGGE